jgi:hypothetical protein
MGSSSGSLGIHGGLSATTLFFDVTKLAVLQQYLKITSCLSFSLVESWLDDNPRRQRYQKMQLLVETPSDKAVVMKPPGFASKAKPTPAVT